MKSKHLAFMFVGSLLMLYFGVFLGDLGGVGGYDGVAPLWLYEKINIQPGNDRLFQAAETGSIVSLVTGLILLIIFFVGLVATLIQKVKSSVKHS